MKKAVVVTVGSPKESLGAMKLARWLKRTGWEVHERTSLEPLFDNGFDLYCFSAVFSWRLPQLVEMAKFAAKCGEVWIGGPAVTFHPHNARYVERETGIRPFIGIDERFEREPGPYPMVYSSRGCPAYGLRPFSEYLIVGRLPLVGITIAIVTSAIVVLLESK